MTRDELEGEQVIPQSICPSCGYLGDRAMGVTTKAPPVPGDLSICVECHALAFFDDDLRQREPTPEEITELMKNPQVRNAIEAMEEGKRRWKKTLN